MKFLLAVAAAAAAFTVCVVNCQDNPGLPPAPYQPTEANITTRQDSGNQRGSIEQEKQFKQISTNDLDPEVERSINHRAECPSGMFSIPPSNACFMLTDERISALTAPSHCAGKGLVFARPSDDIAVPLRQYLLDTYGEQYVWIAARGNGKVQAWLDDGSAVNPALLWPGADKEVSPDRCLATCNFDRCVNLNPDRPYTTYFCTDQRRVLCQAQEEPCLDLNGNCQYWADRGECYINPMYMMLNCKKSCNACENCPCGCGPGTCTGWNTCDCPKPYQQVGYTCLNPANFNKCINYNIYCDAWAARGFCNRSANMPIFCKKACGLPPC